MNELMPILLFLSTESLWFQESQYWSEWVMQGPMETSFRKEYIAPQTWRFIASDKHISVKLSQDRQEIVSLSMTDIQGNKIALQPGMEVWYTPQARIESPMITGEKSCTSTIGNHTCRVAEHKDDEGNIFRWYLLDDIPGGVLQFEAQFEGKETMIQFQMKRFQKKEQ